MLLGEESPMSDRIESFEAFWPFYVREHSKKTTRVLHFVGTTVATAIAATAIVKRKPALIPLALVCGYGPAWIGHFFVENNRPATFKYPAWSFASDYKMWWKIATGQMEAELEKAMAQAPAEEPEAVVTNGVDHSTVN
jgi:hypothetical protein